jgi:hypothetical protein
MKGFERFKGGRVGQMHAQDGIRLKDAFLAFYKRSLEKNESVTLGSNCESGEGECRMYVVFFVPESVSGV